MLKVIDEPFFNVDGYGEGSVQVIFVLEENLANQMDE